VTQRDAFGSRAVFPIAIGSTGLENLKEVNRGVPQRDAFGSRAVFPIAIGSTCLENLKESKQRSAPKGCLWQ